MTEEMEPGGPMTDSGPIPTVDESRLLRPIRPDAPAGELLRYEGTYDRIQEARREEADDLPRGVWQRELKRADWEKVRTLCVDALENRTKDVQIAVWLLEALLHEHGFAGVREGLKLIVALCEGFWDVLHPQIDDGDFEERLSPFVWVNEKLAYSLKFLRITAPSTLDAHPYNFADWEQANALDKLSGQDKKAYAKAESEGKVTRARFLSSVMFTPKSFYDTLYDDISDALDGLERLDRFLRDRCGRDSPTFAGFKEILEQVQRLADKFLSEKEDELPEGEDGSDGREPTGSDESTEETPSRAFLSIRNRSEAYRMLSEAADYLLIHEPHSPTPYLVKRAVSWGNMSLAELLNELVADERDLKQIYKLLGIPHPD